MLLKTPHLIFNDCDTKYVLFYLHLVIPQSSCSVIVTSDFLYTDIEICEFLNGLDFKFSFYTFSKDYYTTLHSSIIYCSEINIYLSKIPIERVYRKKLMGN